MTKEPKNPYEYDPFNPRKNTPRNKNETWKQRNERLSDTCNDPTCMICRPERGWRGDMSYLISFIKSFPPNDPNTVRARALFLQKTGRMWSEDEEENQRNSRLDAETASRRMMENMVKRYKESVAYKGSFTEESEDEKKLKSLFPHVEKYVKEYPDSDFSAVIGQDQATAEIRSLIQDQVKHAELFAAYKMKMPKGVLLYGPPGCGKTAFARTAAAELSRVQGSKVPLLIVTPADLLDPFIGGTEKNIKNLFDWASLYFKVHNARPLIFIDEAEILFPDRTNPSVPNWQKGDVAAFLQALDGFDGGGAFLMLATNRPDTIDEAILRPGRCDIKIRMRRPDAEAAYRILKYYFEKADLPLQDSIEDLIFTAVESCYNPETIIGRSLRVDFKKKEVKEFEAFTFANIVSGALLESIPHRAAFLAFQRDKAEGKVTGITVADVLQTVARIIEENKDLDHSLSVKEFMDDLNEKHGDD